MGEFLRGVFDQNSKFSEPAFYSIEVTVPNPVPSGPLTGVLQAKENKSFLITSINAVTIATDQIGEIALGTSSNLIELFDPLSTTTYGNIPSLGVFLGGPLNGAYTLPDYIELKPAQLIGFRITNDPTAASPLVAGRIICVQLSGIEYGE